MLPWALLFFLFLLSPSFVVFPTPPLPGKRSQSRCRSRGNGVRPLWCMKLKRACWAHSTVEIAEESACGTHTTQWHTQRLTSYPTPRTHARHATRHTPHGTHHTTTQYTTHTTPRNSPQDPNNARRTPHETSPQTTHTSHRPKPRTPTRTRTPQAARGTARYTLHHTAKQCTKQRTSQRKRDTGHRTHTHKNPTNVPVPRTFATSAPRVGTGPWEQTRSSRPRMMCYKGLLNVATITEPRLSRDIGAQLVQFATAGGYQGYIRGTNEN